MNFLKQALLATGLSVVAFSVQAAPVYTVGTNPGGPFVAYDSTNPSTPLDTVGASDPAGDWTLSASPDGIGSQWIWAEGGVYNNQTVSFDYSFSLAGYDLASASLTGFLASDDDVVVTLNGVEIFRDDEAYGSGPTNWQAFQSFPTIAGVFQLDNILRFTVTNSHNGPAGLNATFVVDAAPVPLPAALPLLGGALAGLGLISRYRKRKAAQA